MKIEKTIAVCTLDELSPEARRYAINQYRLNALAPSDEASRRSIYAFCERFGITVKNYSIVPHAKSFVDTDAKPSFFRNLRVSDYYRAKWPDGYDSAEWPTGHKLDATLYGTFKEHHKRNGDAYRAFIAALEAAVKELLAEKMEHLHTDEYIAEHLTANGFLYFNNGRMYESEFDL